MWNNYQTGGNDLVNYLDVIVISLLIIEIVYDKDFKMKEKKMFDATKEFHFLEMEIMCEVHN